MQCVINDIFSLTTSELFLILESEMRNSFNKILGGSFNGVTFFFCIPVEQKGATFVRPLTTFCFNHMYVVKKEIFFQTEKTLKGCNRRETEPGLVCQKVDTVILQF